MHVKFIDSEQVFKYKNSKLTIGEKRLFKIKYRNSIHCERYRIVHQFIVWIFNKKFVINLKIKK